MSAAISAAEGSFKAETPKALFDTRIVTTTRDLWQYDMTSDAQRFIINSRMEHTQEPITLYANWPAEVRK